MDNTEDVPIFKERICIYCGKSFLQPMQIGSQGRLVHIRGTSKKYCSDDCKRLCKNKKIREYRTDNDEWKKRHRERKRQLRREKREEEVIPLYNKLKKLITAHKEKEALALLADISVSRMTQSKEKE